MNFFKGNQQASAENLYQNQIKPELCEKDGNIHIIMINSFSKWLNQMFGVESKYTNQIGKIINKMQEDGYEIVDIKFNSMQNQGLFQECEGFNTLIMYK